MTNKGYKIKLEKLKNVKSKTEAHKYKKYFEKKEGILEKLKNVKSKIEAYKYKKYFEKMGVF